MLEVRYANETGHVLVSIVMIISLNDVKKRNIQIYIALPMMSYISVC